MEKFLSEQFGQLDWLNDQDVALVGVGGSARNVARIHQSEHSYPIGGVHNYTMSDRDIEEVYDLIRKAQRRLNKSRRIKSRPCRYYLTCRFSL